MIKLYKNTLRNAWMACFTGTEGAELRRLFGTNTLPTGFTACANSEHVLRDIQIRNPRAEVVLYPTV